jgi:hypothetical protein
MGASGVLLASCALWLVWLGLQALWPHKCHWPAVACCRLGCEALWPSLLMTRQAAMTASHPIDHPCVSSAWHKAEAAVPFLDQVQVQSASKSAACEHTSFPWAHVEHRQHQGYRSRAPCQRRVLHVCTDGQGCVWRVPVGCTRPPMHGGACRCGSGCGVCKALGVCKAQRGSW